jgi:hypothetical protein
MVRKRRKKGTPYEEVVSEVLRTMDSGAVISQGVWVEGPDGRRELDIRIVGTFEGKVRRVLIECKDYNPASTGKVGIEHIDALESKRRDLEFHFSAVCSNAGFTEGAVKKASRVGIGLISVMKKGDKRVRFSVSEEIFTRKVQVTELRTTLHGPDISSTQGTRLEDITFNGIPVQNWVTKRVMLFIGSNPIVAGSYTATHAFKEELLFELPSSVINVSQLDIRLSITGRWYAQMVNLDATQGIYDWLRHRVRLAPGPGQFMIEGVDIEAGEPIDLPPARELEQQLRIQPGEMVARLILITGLEPHEPIPQLDDFVMEEDLVFIISDLPPEAYTSVND